jgi:acyl carrier protein
LFVSALALPEDTDFSTLTYRSVPQWDSVAHMSLIARLEAALGIMLETDDVLDMSSFEECLRIIGRHGVQVDDP